MKVVKLLIVIFLILVYAYSVKMTYTNPAWGWVCAIIFLILALIGIYEFSNQPKNSENET
jgi:hypothetical protein